MIGIEKVLLNLPEQNKLHYESRTYIHVLLGSVVGKLTHHIIKLELTS